MLLIKTPGRGTDAFGSGAYGAPRRGRKHKGEDFACWPGSELLSLTGGVLTKIGFPYPLKDDTPIKNTLRYVQVTVGPYDLRYFYVEPTMNVGDTVATGDVIGRAQDLTKIWRDMTPHIHFEVKENGDIIDPNKFLARVHAGEIT